MLSLPASCGGFYGRVQFLRRLVGGTVFVTARKHRHDDDDDDDQMFDHSACAASADIR